MLPPISLQLWSVRDETQNDFAGTMLKVRAMGFDAVETAGYGNLDAAGAAAAVQAAGLGVSGMHVGEARLRLELEAVIAEAKALGCREVVCPSWPKAALATAAGAAVAGAQLGAIGAALRAADLRLSFHNHAVEYTTVDGKCIMEWMLDAAAPRDLGAEPDVYWIHRGGADPVTELRRLGARARLVHLKDEKELGGGPVDFPAVLATLQELAVAEVYVVEQEAYTTTSLAGVAASVRQLRNWLGR